MIASGQSGLSKLNRVLENGIPKIWADGPFGDYIDLSSEQVFQILHGCDQIQQIPAGLQIDQKIDVAPGLIFAAGGGTEHPNIFHAIAGRDSADLILLSPEQVNGRTFSQVSVHLESRRPGRTAL